MKLSRRILLAAGGTALVSGNGSTHAQAGLEPRAVIPQVDSDDYWEIDDSGLDSLREDPALYLWDDPEELLGKKFTITAKRIDYWASQGGYVATPTQAVYQSLMHLRLAGRDFFIAVNENVRPYRHFMDIRADGYYGGLMAIEMDTDLYYQATGDFSGHRIPA